MNIVLHIYKKEMVAKTFLDVNYTLELEKNQIGGKYDIFNRINYINKCMDI